MTPTIWFWLGVAGAVLASPFALYLLTWWAVLFVRSVQLLTNLFRDLREQVDLRMPQPKLTPPSRPEPMEARTWMPPVQLSRQLAGALEGFVPTGDAELDADALVARIMDGNVAARRGLVPPLDRSAPTSYSEPRREMGDVDAFDEKLIQAAREAERPIAPGSKAAQPPPEP